MKVFFFSKSEYCWAIVAELITEKKMLWRRQGGRSSQGKRKGEEKRGEERRGE